MTSRQLATILCDILSEYSAINDETPLKAAKAIEKATNSLYPSVILSIEDGSEFQIDISEIKRT